MPRLRRTKKPQRDLFWATMPLFIISRVLGVAPFPLKYGNGLRQTSKKLIAYSRLSFLFALISSLFYLPDMVHVQLQQSSVRSIPINAYVNASWWVMCVLVGAVGFACFYSRRTWVHLLLLEVVRFDASSRLRRSLLYRRTRRLLLLHSIGLFTLALLAVLHQVYSALTQALQDSNELTLLGLYWLMVIMVLDSQFSILAWIIKERFRMINDGVSLVVLSESTEKFPFILSAIGIGEDIKRLNLKLKPTFGGRNALSSYVRVLATLNMSLFRLVRKLCEAYGPLLLAQTCSNLVQVTFHIYYYIEEMMGLLSYDDTVYIVGDLAVWCFPYVIGISMILASSFVTTREADQTGVLVSEALLKVKDHQARRELRLFSHQLLHTKVRFTACGFFSLDFSLLTSMTAAVVTHLVILVQFQLAGKDSQSPCNCTQDNMTSLMTSLMTTPVP